LETSVESNYGDLQIDHTVAYRKWKILHNYFLLYFFILFSQAQLTTDV